MKLSGTDGIRNAMRSSYKHHYKIQLRSPGTDDSPHQAGLFGALASRNKVLGIDYSEVNVWIELTPFLHMLEEESLNALFEYAVYREATAEMRVGKLGFLKDSLNRVIAKMIETQSDIDRLTVAIQKRFMWVILVDKKILSLLFEDKEPSFYSRDDFTNDFFNHSRLQCFVLSDLKDTHNFTYMFYCGNAVFFFKTITECAFIVLKNVEKVIVDNAFILSGISVFDKPTDGPAKVSLEFMLPKGSSLLPNGVFPMNSVIDFVHEVGGKQTSFSNQYRKIPRPLDIISTLALEGAKQDDEEKTPADYISKQVTKPSFDSKGEYEDYYYFFYKYNEIGHKIKAEYYNQNDNLLWYLTYEYDGQGYKIAKKKHNRDGTLVRTDHFTYDEKNRLTAKNGDEETYEYDYNDKLIKRIIRVTGPKYETVLYEYDDNGREIKETYFNSDGEPFLPIVKEYDDEDKLIKSIHMDTKGNPAAYDIYEYDDEDRLTNFICYDYEGKLEYQDAYEYDEQGNKIKCHLIYYR